MKAPKNRIKPTFLREIKTEALLVFIRTTLITYFERVENGNEEVIIDKKEDIEKISKCLNILHNDLKDKVVDSRYIQTLTNHAQHDEKYRILLLKEEPLCIYYNDIVQELSKNLKDGSKWIPEILIISLLTEWLIEEEKSIALFPFLKKFDYIELFNIYDNIRLKDIKSEKAETIKSMYKLSSNLINALKKSKYKHNRVKPYTKKNRKSRKKR